MRLTNPLTEMAAEYRKAGGQGFFTNPLAANYLECALAWEREAARLEAQRRIDALAAGEGADEYSEAPASEDGAGGKAPPIGIVE